MLEPVPFAPAARPPRAISGRDVPFTGIADPGHRLLDNHMPGFAGRGSEPSFFALGMVPLTINRSAARVNAT